MERKPEKPFELNPNLNKEKRCTKVTIMEWNAKEFRRKIWNRDDSESSSKKQESGDL